MKKIALLLIITLLCGACGNYQHDTIPYRKVDITLSVGDPNYYMLNHDGGYLYLTGGVNGIIVYRMLNEFKAYDRACPYDWENSNSWLCYEPSELMIHDSCCGSRFNIIDGTVMNGPARHPLKYYRTSFDGMLLRIYN